MASSKDKKKQSSHSGKSILVSFICFVVFSLCFIPLVVSARILIYFISFNQLWHWLLLPFILYIGIALFIVSLLVISGGIIKLFNIKYSPGTYEYSLKDKNSFRWVVVCSLYTPCRKLLEMVPVGRLKNIYFRLLGMKIGENTLIGGVIKDPCVTEVGDNTTIGEYAILYAHMHNYEKQILQIEKITIGNNCIIGAGAIIMPGAVIEDNVVVAAAALVKKNQILSKNKTYAGIPAKEIKQ
ncbi:MAG: DapH/DapD/GlmU-related protein [Thermoplasmatota archaeon]